MHPEDKEKISFIIEEGTFYYIQISFDLKNAGVTYQHLVKKMFKDQLAKNMEAYIDHTKIKSI